MELQDIAAQCESVGANCEFGLIQDHFGIQRIGLLRWAGSRFGRLVDAFRHRFDGLLETATGDADLSQRPVWWLRDDRYDILFHTPRMVAGMDAATATDLERPRVRRLAEKLLEDVALGDRLFVYSNVDMPEPENAAPLADAMRRIGPKVWLLAVCADPARAGQVRTLGPGLIGAYIGRLTTYSNANKFDLAEWASVLPQSHAIWSAHQ